MCHGFASSASLVAVTAQPCSSGQLEMLGPLLQDLRAWSRSDGNLPSDGGLSQVLSALKRHRDSKAVLSHYSGLVATHDELFAGVAETQMLTPESMALPSLSAQTPLKVPTVPHEIEAILEEED
eukprot:398134-Amphidinium_carterae.1